MAKPSIKDADDYTEQLIEPLAEIFEQLNNNVVGVISRRLNEIGKLSVSDLNAVINLARIDDLKEIEELLAKAQKKSVKEIQKIIEESAKYNDGMYDELYKAKKVANLGIGGNEMLMAITAYASKNIKEDVLNLSKTAAFVLNGKPTSIRKAYTQAVNLAALSVKSGVVDYSTAIRQTVSNLASSGLRTVGFDSGYSRRLDSQVRMNVLDGVNMMNQEYREQQGKEFGANGIEISAHFNCAEDHLDIQGKQYTKKKFQKLQETLKRPIGTMNCRHRIFPVILGLQEPAYTDKQLQMAKEESTKLVTYDLMNGEKKTVTKYEATQIQRKIETNLRRLKEKRLQFENDGDSVMVSKYNKLIRENSAYYKKVSAQVGLKTQMERARIVK